ncbi:carboxymuconolactone decarboxylase family protein [Ancylobacter sp. SL191]|uniref:carboxymuconolactone decarboxylase family protein n=1 Tax=Ancylobacter sp. SL191 TaxID=2995166 RepID=UPI00226F238F|nr:carboxymuconolactone decarboxylase family protein [Ancylobacter sp. SL191]WAC28325.1 carboxymuconolactone decarboxylase family protein [Ancylobacter sp. SL191]
MADEGEKRFDEVTSQANEANPADASTAPRPASLPLPEVLPDDRRARGEILLAAITGRSGAQVMASLADIAPDFAGYIFEFGYGDIYARPGLDLRTRLIATVAGLVCLGHAERELEVHIGSALTCGASREEVVEAIMQMALYAGFPAALNALMVAKRVFAARDADASDTPPAP